MRDLKVNLANLFPMSVHGHNGMNREMYRLFNKYKPEKMSYYEVDMVIRSQTQVVFKVYGMSCATYGGRGILRDTLEVTVDRNEVDLWISSKIDKMAEDREAYEVRMARQARVKEISKIYRAQLRRQMRAQRSREEETA